MKQAIRLPSIDGWRAVSILLVLGSHFHFSSNFPQNLDRLFIWIFDGNLGVRFFFVISGFLITYLLLREHENTGAISLRKFYIRRALRILPVYYAFLSVVLAFQLFTSWKQPLHVWVGNVTFTTNFFGLARATGHLWSLAVEEQFYLLWPFVLVFAGCQNRQKLICLLSVPLLLAPLCREISATGIAPAVLHPFFLEFSFLNYCDSLAAGCLAAVAFTRKEPIKWPMGIAGCMVLGGLLILIPHILSMLGLAKIIMDPWGMSFQALGIVILLLRSISDPQYFKPLNWTFIRHLGVLSYSIYIWQQICWAHAMNFAASKPWYVSSLLCLVIIYLISSASYYGLEKPLMGLRARYRKTTA